MGAAYSLFGILFLSLSNRTKGSHQLGLVIISMFNVQKVVGDPIPCEQNDNPSQEMIDDMHALYCERLKALFDKYKDQYDPDRVEELTFI